MTFYHEGYEAFGRGVTLNPYHPGTAGHIYWQRGWDEAEDHYMETISA